MLREGNKFNIGYKNASHSYILHIYISSAFATVFYFLPGVPRGPYATGSMFLDLQYSISFLFVR